MSRYITITQNKYGTGYGTATLQIRGHDTTSFLQDAVSPSWETYSGVVSKSWRFIQVRVIKT
jgi:hypothetical protein